MDPDASARTFQLPDAPFALNASVGPISNELLVLGLQNTGSAPLQFSVQFFELQSSSIQMLFTFSQQIIVLSIIGIVSCACFILCLGCLRHTYFRWRKRQEAHSLEQLFNEFNLSFPYQQALHAKLDVCSICLEDYTESALVRRLICGHTFHAPCFDEWRVKSLNCPQCRFDLSLQNLLKWQNGQHRRVGAIDLDNAAGREPPYQLHTGAKDEQVEQAEQVFSADRPDLQLATPDKMRSSGSFLVNREEQFRGEQPRAQQQELTEGDGYVQGLFLSPIKSPIPLRHTSHFPKSDITL